MKLSIHLILTTAILSLISCSSILPVATQKRIFILAYNAGQQCAASSDIESRLLVKEDQSGSQQYTNKIWFQKGAELGFYQFAEWSEPVTDRFSRLIDQALRCTQTNSIQNGETLDFSILNFVHNAEQQPGDLSLSIRLIFSKVSGTQREKTFSYSEPLKSYDVLGVVEASNIVAASFLKDLEGFLDEN